MELELKVSNTLTGAIQFNYQELKGQLIAQLDNYRNIIVTEDTIPEAKKTRANLNKVKKVIDDERKKAKEEALKPYYEIEGKFKELISIIDEVITTCDNQLLVFEDNRKEAKKKEIENLFYEKSMSALIKLEQIFDSKWLNATTSLKNVDDILNSIDERITNDVKLIQLEYPDDSNNILTKYLNTLDRENSIKSYFFEKEALEKVKTLEIATPKTTNVEIDNNAVEEKVLFVKLKLIGTKTQLDAAMNFFKEKAIKIEKLN